MIARVAAGSGLLFLLAAALLGDDAALRDKLTGKWRQGAFGGDEGEVWSLETVGDSLRVSRIRAAESD